MWQYLSNAEMLKHMIEKGQRVYLCADLIFEVRLENILPDGTLLVDDREFKIFSIDIRKSGIYVVPSYKSEAKITYWKVPLQGSRKDKIGRNT